MFPLINCPEEFSLGYRTTPGQKVPEFAGNTCEPWIARYAVVVLDKLLDPGALGARFSPPRHKAAQRRQRDGFRSWLLVAWHAAACLMRWLLGPCASC